MASAADGKRICVAQIGGAHGVRGEVRLKSFTAEPEAVARYGALHSEDGRRTLEVVSVRPAKDHLVARFKGIADRNAAEALRGIRLYVDRAALAPPDDDEFYHADLIGLEARAPDGRVIGAVVGVQNFGAGDLLEISPMDGGASEFVPFTKAVVPRVEIAAGHVVIDPPAGVFDGADKRAGEE